MKLIVGLGNPGQEYKNTRHNVGYMYLDYILGDKFSLNKKFEAEEYITIINSEKVIFIKPITFMNDSGESLIKYVNYYKIDVSDILVIQDDLDMDVGKIKLMYNHGDGGHNGIKSIINCLKTKSFLRLKIGISSLKEEDIVTYVLGKFSLLEMKKIKKSFKDLEDFIDDYLVMNKDNLMGKYNSKILEEKDECI